MAIVDEFCIDVEWPKAAGLCPSLTSDMAIPWAPR
jgi:hypothetical protein